jgi:hypothetical protein
MQKKVIKRDSPYLLNQTSYLKEYCTVKVATARMSGHTYASSKYALELMAKGKNVLVLSHNLEIAKRVCRQCLEICSKKKVKVDRYTIHRIESNGGRIIFGSKRSELARFSDSDWDCIIVDVASFWPPKDVDNVYKTLGPCLARSRFPIILFME